MLFPSFDALVSNVITNTDGASTLVLPAPGQGLKLYVTEITIVNTSATPVTVDIRDGVSGGVLWTLSVPANDESKQTFVYGLGGFTENTGVAIDASAAVTSLIVSMNGFKRMSR